eukprot:134972-Rhodomonas_salina.7
MARLAESRTRNLQVFKRGIITSQELMTRTHHRARCNTIMQDPGEAQGTIYPPAIGQVPAYNELSPHPRLLLPQAGSDAPSLEGTGIPSQTAIPNSNADMAQNAGKGLGKHVFEFRDCVYKVKAKGGEKTLLHGSIANFDFVAQFGAL